MRSLGLWFSPAACPQDSSSGPGGGGRRGGRSHKPSVPWHCSDCFSLSWGTPPAVGPGVLVTGGRDRGEQLVETMK